MVDLTNMALEEALKQIRKLTSELNEIKKRVDTLEKQQLTDVNSYAE
ncbi:hypothetical protein [Facklamia sp. P9177]